MTLLAITADPDTWGLYTVRQLRPRARRCPHDVIRYEFCETTYTLTPQIDPGKCTGCGTCGAACPTTPEQAIVVCPA